MDKQAVRETVWDAFEERGEARFPFPPHDRIPNFAGADAACDRLTDTDAWASASTLKCNPDAPQLPVRRAALRDGKTVYVAQPRLRDADPFLRIDPADLVDVGSVDSESADVDADGPTVDDATTRLGHLDARHARRSRGRAARRPRGRRLRGRHDRRRPNREGWGVQRPRVGRTQRTRRRRQRGAKRLWQRGTESLGQPGFAGDSRAKPDDGATTVATTVHELSVLDGPESPIADPAELPAPDAHDVPLDLVVTPERTIRTETPYARVGGIDWDALDDDKLAAIPVLAERAPGRK